MPTRDDIAWFKKEFGADIRRALVGSPFSIDMLTAIACQETGYIWSTLRKKGLSTAQVLRLCVGDSIDGNPNGTGRRAFPRTKSELLAKPNGDQAFDIGRQALVEMSEHIRGYAGAVRNPNKFCRGYGIFQYDLQHYLTDPAYFLGRGYEHFDRALEKCLAELRAALIRVGLRNRTQLNEQEMAAVAIAYNRGSYNPRKGLKQGHFDGRRYYGELFMDFLRLAKTVAEPGEQPQLNPPAAGESILSPPTPVVETGDRYIVDTRTSDLRVRSEPRVDRSRPRRNVIADLPDGHPVRAVGAAPVNGFLEIETNLRGALVRGFASTEFLKLVRAALPSLPPPATSLVGEARLLRRPGSVTRRVDPAGAHSLNEQGQPGRRGTTSDALRVELARIIDWLAVNDPRHKRYLGGSGKTYCNIYAHDYCDLAGVYLPRVWWNGRALERLGAGENVPPRYGATVDEMRANDLFRWLRDFGSRFGWRQTGTLTKLQTEVNHGALGLVVARRRIEGKSGHIVMVVPETATQSARRDGEGEVVAPLQSQAGATNFQYGFGRPEWWRGEQFVEFAFWLHA
ncbi:MAG TPA: hypothetical protein VMN38_02070 [Sphingomicrobium sp.]|nr:hypothetical protein [Sphingomicrobium sp.]